MLLEVENLTTEFTTRRGKVRAIRDVSFSIGKGEILALVGESGSGKSVTSLSIMGLLNSNGRVVEGSKIMFDGVNLLDLSERKMQQIRGNRISMIFQEPMTSLNPIFTVGDQILENIRLHTRLSRKEAHEKLLHIMDTVGIPNPARRIKDYPHQMSGGMRQRIMIAMAMACQPKLLIADEPTTALDVTIQAQILDLIYRMREQFNISVLLITHDLGVVAEAADRVAVMYCGRIVEQGTTTDILTDPKHPYSNGLLKSIPRLDGQNERLFMIPGMVPPPEEVPAGCAFADRCEHAREECRARLPDLVTMGDRKVRCINYSTASQA
ncbi:MULTISPECIES: ABC transporter ATP-binding protein [unclassified Anaerobiospirillum]|uniref:ABC transporter ATP-binding protein n=1 Tax=unclassified Anaerobiospirillum TaxID=2647410 RepID=UPI001FF6EB81|nr:MULTISPECIES: ABC transporter ATP-binding protein [unclassified Anaerobiospirillum]MCK0535712.1 ABC transporter ATP-binding protein [Anaerobiospirillum sp. NML120511]MCK0540838.1 ABC transporter ATP-binding protein [Anaerobiospirillum sp. NML02-A-032]